MGEVFIASEGDNDNLSALTTELNAVADQSESGNNYIKVNLLPSSQSAATTAEALYGAGMFLTESLLGVRVSLTLVTHPHGVGHCAE